MAKAPSSRGLLEIPLRRLRTFRELSAIDEAVVRGLTLRGDDLFAGDRIELGPRQLWVVLSGWACSFQALQDGRRQIFGLILPGDAVGDMYPGLPMLCPSIEAISSVVLADAAPLAAGEVADLPRHPTILQALRAAQMHRDSYIYDHVVRLGAHNAYERVGHLMLEVFDRLSTVGLTNGDQFIMPLTQERLGEMLGLSETHVNRTVRQLRQDGLLSIRTGCVALPDRDRLAAVVGSPIPILRRA